MPPRDLMLFAIFRILPKRSFELTFFGDVDRRFLMFVLLPLADGVALLIDADELVAAAVLGFFR